jgi:excisionase family DNA binding protein
LGLFSAFCDLLAFASFHFISLYLTERFAMAESQRLLLSMKQVADILGVSLATIQKHTLDGSIPTRKIGGLVRIHQSDVDRIVEQGYSLPSLPHQDDHVEVEIVRAG